MPIRPGIEDRARAAPSRPSSLGPLARAARLPARIRHGRPARLAVRILAAAALAAAIPGRHFVSAKAAARGAR
ncbi:MAG: hypothetical protein ACRDNF_06250 [Streptosporangiaceae bacterium]